jgi:hypothetical protein
VWTNEANGDSPAVALKRSSGTAFVETDASQPMHVRKATVSSSIAQSSPFPCDGVCVLRVYVSLFQFKPACMLTNVVIPLPHRPRLSSLSSPLFSSLFVRLSSLPSHPSSSVSLLSVLSPSPLLTLTFENFHQSTQLPSLLLPQWICWQFATRLFPSRG